MGTSAEWLHSLADARPFLKWSSTPFDVVQIPSFATTLEGWSNPFRQHDVVEFAAHLLSQAHSEATTCRCEARWELDTVLEVWDQGSPWQPLLLQHEDSTAWPGLQRLMNFRTWGDGYCGRGAARGFVLP